MNDYDQWIYDRWAIAFDDATEKVLELLPGSSQQVVRDTIEDAHTIDDPEWQFSRNALLATLIGDRKISDDTFESLEDLFPVKP